MRRCKGDEVLLEGPHLLGEALSAGIVPRTVLATPEFLATTQGQALACRLPSPPREVAQELLDEVSDADSPRGILAIAVLQRPGVTALPVTAGAIYVYGEALQDPGNLGALARSAEASGAAGLALSPTSVSPNHPRALRASAGSLLRLPTAVAVTVAELDDHLSAAAPRWVVLAPRGGRDLYGTPLDGTLILALGAEGPGLSEALRERADTALTIPLEAPVESLNVTVAAAVALFELRRRRRELQSTSPDGVRDPGGSLSRRVDG